MIGLFLKSIFSKALPFFRGVFNFLKKSIKIPIGVLMIVLLLGYCANKKISNLKNTVRNVNFQYSICRENSDLLQQKLKQQNDLIQKLHDQSFALKKEIEEMNKKIETQATEEATNILENDYPEIFITMPQIKEMPVEERKACIRAKEIAIKELGLR